jgi:hypothetical protein
LVNHSHHHAHHYAHHPQMGMMPMTYGGVGAPNTNSGHGAGSHSRRRVMVSAFINDRSHQPST